MRFVELQIDDIRQEHSSTDQLTELHRDRLKDYKRTYYRHDVVIESRPCQRDLMSEILQ